MFERFEFELMSDFKDDRMVGEFFIFVAIFVGIMAFSALIFGTWFIVMVFRGVAGFLGLRGEPHADVKGPTAYEWRGADRAGGFEARVSV